MSRKTWTEKFAAAKSREVKIAPKDFADIAAGQMMLLTTPHDVAEFVAGVPRGTEIGMKGLRAGLAKKFGAEISCPVVTGIQLRTVAEVTGQQLDAGIPANDVVPVWRVLGPGAPIWKKLENGRAQFLALRQNEGLPV